MKKQIVEQFVIYVIFAGGRKKYLTGTSKRPDGKLLPVDYKPEVDDAHTWNTEAEVVSVISRIHNVYDREFKYEPIRTVEEKGAKILGGKLVNSNSII
jgi:hypothetical protein